MSQLERLARALTRPPRPIDSVGSVYGRVAEACGLWTRLGPVCLESRPARLSSVIDLSPLAPAAWSLAKALDRVVPWHDPWRVACAPEDHRALVALGVPTGYAGLLACLLAGAREWDLAAELGCMVPPPVVEGPDEDLTPRFNRPPPSLVGRAFRDLPNPKTALVELACEGYVIGHLRASVVTLWAVYGEDPLPCTVTSFEDCCGLGCEACTRVENDGWRCPACEGAWVGRRERHTRRCPVGGRDRIEVRGGG